MPEEPNEQGTEGGQETPEAPQDDAPAGGQQAAGRVLTEEEHQAILNEQVSKRGKRFVNQFITGLGFDDPEGLQAALKELKEFKQSQMSEQERVEAQVLEAQQTAMKAQAERDEALAQAQETLIRAAFLAEAGRQGAKYPDDAFNLADRSSVTTGDNGEVEGVDTAVKALVESGRLPLVGKPQAPTLDAGAGGGDRPGDKPVKLSDDELEIAKKMGMSPEDYSKFK